MNAEEYIIKRIQELEEENRLLTQKVISNRDELKELSKANIKSCDIITEIIEGLGMYYDHTTQWINTGVNSFISNNQDLINLIERVNQFKEDKSE